MIEWDAAGERGAGADSPPEAPASGRPGTAPPGSSRSARLCGVPSRRPLRHLFEPGDVVEPAEHRGADDLHALREPVAIRVGLHGQALGRVGDARPEALVGAGRAR